MDTRSADEVYRLHLLPIWTGTPPVEGVWLSTGASEFTGRRFCASFRRKDERLLILELDPGGEAAAMVAEVPRDTRWF